MPLPTPARARASAAPHRSVPRRTANQRAAAGAGADQAIAQVVEKVLVDFEAQERAEMEGAKLAGSKHQVEVEADGSQVSSRMLADVKAQRVSFFKGEVQETCEATCKHAALKCTPRWFKVLNRCEVLLGAFPTAADGSYLKTCGSQFYGHDLPGYQTEMKQLLLNNDIENFPTTCGGRGDYTKR